MKARRRLCLLCIFSKSLLTPSRLSSSHFHSVFCFSLTINIYSFSIFHKNMDKNPKLPCQCNEASSEGSTQALPALYLFKIPSDAFKTVLFPLPFRFCFSSTKKIIPFHSFILIQKIEINTHQVK